MTSTMAELVAEMERVVALKSRRDAEAIERRLLAGENHIVLRQKGGPLLVLQVPAWTSRPIQRMRIELARWRSR